MTAVRPTPDSEATPSKNGKAMKKPQRPDFAARDEVLGKLQEKVQEFSAKAKTAASELDALQNEAKTNSKMEACRRGLANTVHTKTQTKVRVKRSCQRWEATQRSVGFSRVWALHANARRMQAS
jgi:Skp family chaperone for outer membrane proteins